MPFLSLTPYNFRNLQNKVIDLCAKEVFFCGKNGQGKSNILETLYYSSYGSSFRTRYDSETVKKGETSMSIHSIYREECGITHTTNVKIDKNRKTIEKDGKVIHDRKELINTMPCVLYNHDDLSFAVGEPERRRFFIDQSLSMYDLVYIDTQRNYKKILKNRNLILKEQKYDLLDMYDMQLVKSGLEIQEKRSKAIFQFNQIFGRLYQDITGIDGVSIKYSPSWKKKDNGSCENEESYILSCIKNKRDAEKVMCSTLSGPHRDRITFVRDGSDFVSTASTGQRRLIALILRTAQAVYYNQITGKKPVLLMDDVMLELDPEKRQKLTALLPEYEQLICTFLPGEPYKNYMRESTIVYSVENGKLEVCNG